MSRTCFQGAGRIFRRAPLAVAGWLLCAPFSAGANPLTNVQTVFLIVMENKDWDGILGNADCPYINGTLLPMASRAEQYSTPHDLHPSEPNYLWLEAGTNFGVLNDDNPDRNHFSTTNHLVDLLENAGISWKTYQESYQPPDSPLVDRFPYAAHHDPFVFFDDVSKNPGRLAAHVRPYSELASDLRAGTAARYNFIVPNLTNDMHSPAGGGRTKERQGDDWLRREVPGILASGAYTRNGALFIVWDEGHKKGPIGLILLSPLARGGGYRNQVAYTHSSLLRTVQEIFGVRPFLGEAADATPLVDLFRPGGGAAAGPAPALVVSRDRVSGSAEVELGGLIPGRRVLLQASANLLDWVTLCSDRPAGASLTVVDPDPAASGGGAGRRFYRAVEWP